MFDVRVELPCTPSHARVARTVAAACGVLEGFSIDDLGDLRLLVDEVFGTMHALGVHSVELLLAPAHGEVIVLMRSCGTIGPGRPDVDAQSARRLADVIARDVRFDLLGSPPTFAATMSPS